jgi:hypothetical protein
MHSLVIGLIGAAVGFALGWYVKGRLGSQLAAVEADVKKL